MRCEISGEPEKKEGGEFKVGQNPLEFIGERDDSPHTKRGEREDPPFLVPFPFACVGDTLRDPFPLSFLRRRWLNRELINGGKRREGEVPTSSLKEKRRKAFYTAQHKKLPPPHVWRFPPN